MIYYMFNRVTGSILLQCNYLNNFVLLDCRIFQWPELQSEANVIHCL